jgi:hypothetical protein
LRVGSRLKQPAEQRKGGGAVGHHMVKTEEDPDVAAREPGKQPQLP